MLEEPIGQGATGVVYRARHTRVSRLFAVKFLYPAIAANARSRTRFAHEAEAASRLSHSNVISVIDFGEFDDLFYLVMDYVEGKPLSRIIAEAGPLPPERVLSLTRQLLRGLHHAHERGLVHRDFKADNVIVERNGAFERARIVDFGLAILPDEDDSRLTADGLIVGTPAYMSPEQASGGEVDLRTDLYALGVLMYEMLAGRLPFDGTPLAMVSQNLAVEPPPIRERTPTAEISPALEAIVQRLLEKEPGRRFDSAAEVLGEIDRVQGPPGGTLTTMDMMAVRTPARRFWRRGVLVLALAALAGGGALGWRALGRAGDAAADGEAGVMVAEAESVSESEPEPESEAEAESVSESEPEPESEAETTLEVVAEADMSGERASAAAPDRDDARRRRKRGRSREARRKRAERAAEQASGEAARGRNQVQEPGDEVAEEITVGDLRARYQSVGALVDRLAREQSGDVAKPLQARYLAIPYLDALRVPALRSEAYRELGNIARGARRALGQ